MAYKIIWTENAKHDLKAIIEYLEDEWSLNTAQKFIAKLYLRLDIIKRLPFIGKQSNKYSEVRKILITKHNSLYYQVLPEEKIILLLDFFDNRQHWEKDNFA
ncbi:MAG: hypothetical protein A3K10_14245 [Bacteroidetes bacterium RIFCSPLOWO2_12_FULL_31_6]|nr:MAG: hypothetical protein A3K10_14245 [Bacteroidetes bacterium RIFCSPLOWO2_12_FULL_31_6]